MFGSSAISTWWLAVATAVVFLGTAQCCNEAVCGSVVSKCLLTQACKCDLVNCTCCKDCFNCLNHLYSECCSCVGMCPNPEDEADESPSISNSLSRKSYVEDLPSPVPALFRALTELPDGQGRWNVTVFPVDLDLASYAPKPALPAIHVQDADSVPMVTPATVTINCTVAFVSECMSLDKCKTKCQSMGAASYRWFHDGCCQCIGDTCINYGINQSRCKNCPFKNEEDEEDYPLDDDDSILYDEDEE